MVPTWCQWKSDTRPHGVIAVNVVVDDDGGGGDGGDGTGSFYVLSEQSQ